MLVWKALPVVAKTRCQVKAGVASIVALIDAQFHWIVPHQSLCRFERGQTNLLYRSYCSGALVPVPSTKMKGGVASIICSINPRTKQRHFLLEHQPCACMDA